MVALPHPAAPKGGPGTAAGPQAGEARPREEPPYEVEAIHRFTRPLTPEEFWALPLVQEAEGPVELVDGEVHVMAPPTGQHGGVAAPLFAALYGHVRARGGPALGRVLPETTYRLTCSSGRPPGVRQPDLSFVSARRLAAAGITPADALPKTFLPAAPELAVEVLSDHERRNPRQVRDKLRDYEEGGVLLVWYVDADLRVVRVSDFRPGPGRRRRTRLVRGQAALTAPGVLPGFRLPLPLVWAG